MKKTNNKGFSLVELIVVVAIMAVLMVVLAPQYLRYVEKTRLQKDNSAIAEIANAMKIAMADETINSKIDNGTKVTITCAAGDNATITFGADSVKKADGTTAATELATELQAVIGNTYTTSSNTYKASGTNIVLEIQTTSGIKVHATGMIEVANSTDTVTKDF